MSAGSNGRFLNPQGALQVYENLEDLSSKFYNYRAWELPPGATADMVRNDPTITFSSGLTGQLNRCFGRSVWPREVQGHINPGAPGQGTGRLYQFVSKVSFPSEQHEGYRAPIFLRLTRWSSGARRRGNDERRLYMCSGYVFGLFSARGSA